jgi:hypothetical protein
MKITRKQRNNKRSRKEMTRQFDKKREKRTPFEQCTPQRTVKKTSEMAEER